MSAMSVGRRDFLLSIWLDKGRQLWPLIQEEEVDFGHTNMNRKGRSPGTAQPEMASRQTAPRVQFDIFGITEHTLRDRSQSMTVQQRWKLYIGLAFSGKPQGPAHSQAATGALAVSPQTSVVTDWEGPPWKRLWSSAC